VNDPDRAGKEMHALVERLHPICRSMTGDGVRRTLEIIGESIPLDVHEVPTGTQVLDWTIPQEWNIRDAYVKDASGRRVIDFTETPLHVVGYSAPVEATMPLSQLREHLHTLPDRPGLVPYRTGYYAANWGFCLSEDTLQELQDGEYEVRIDATLADGHLTYAEHVVPGELDDEVIIVCHTCHPALANETLAGIAVAVQLAQALAESRPRHTYRFVFAPGTIGSITWLARNRDRVDRIKHGFVLACAGDPGHLTYKRSRRGDTLIDRAAAHVLSAREHELLDFTPYGYDERQFCSPGFNLPVGLLTRSPNEAYPEYHTSADDPDFVTPAAMADTLAAVREIVEVLEENRTYLNLQPYGEPQLGKRGLYRSPALHKDNKQHQMAILWILNYSDGDHSLLDIAERSAIPFTALVEAARALSEGGLLDEATQQPSQPHGERA
jgi:aminopeptidase-like protein